MAVKFIYTGYRYRITRNGFMNYEVEKAFYNYGKIGFDGWSHVSYCSSRWGSRLSVKLDKRKKPPRVIWEG